MDWSPVANPVSVAFLCLSYTLAPFWLCCGLPFSIPQFSSVMWLPAATVYPDTWKGIQLSVPASKFLEKGSN